MSAAKALAAASVDDAEFRRKLADNRPFPYEKLMGAAASQAVGSAERILSEGWRLGQHPPQRLDDDLPWDDAGARSRSWNFHLNCWDLLDDLLTAHTQTNERKYLEPAVKVALSWIVTHTSVEGATGVHAWYDMAVGVRAYRLAYILDVAAREPWVTDAEVRAMRDNLELHRRELTDDTKIAFHNNHGFYQVAGQLAMARRFGALSAPMRESLAQANARFLSMLGQQFTDEGVHREHSPDYHRMVYDTLKGIVDAGLFSDPAVEARVDLIERNLSWFIMPNGYLANFGDSDYRLCSRGTRAALDAWRTPEMRHAVTAGQIGAPPPETMRVFEASGYFVVKGRPAEGAEHEQAPYLAQIAAFHSRTHKHADDLSFIWHDRGMPLLVDAGRYGYDGKTEVGSALWQDGFWYSDPNRVYCESTRAHNTVEIDGRNYPRKGIKPYGSALKRWGTVGTDVYYCESETKLFKSIRHVRLLLFRPGQWLLVWDWLHDNVEAEHDYRQWLHFAPELSLRSEGAVYVASASRLEQPLRVTSLLPDVQLGKPVLGREEPVRQGWWSPKGRIILPSYAADLKLGGRSAVFATVLHFCDQLEADASSRVAPSGRNGHLKWRADGRRHLITLSRPEDGPIEMGYRED